MVKEKKTISVEKVKQFAEGLKNGDKRRMTKEEKLEKCLDSIIYMVNNGLHTKNELAFARLIAEGKELCTAESTNPSPYALPGEILGLWEQTVCEIRSEVKSWGDTYNDKFVIDLCDKLEHSMCAIAGGNYKLKYDIFEEDNND